MKKATYNVFGNKKQGFRVAIPTKTGVQKGDKYECTILSGNRLMYTLVKRDVE